MLLPVVRVDLIYTGGEEGNGKFYVWTCLLGEVYKLYIVLIKKNRIFPAEQLCTPLCLEQVVVCWDHSPHLEHLDNFVKDSLDVVLHSDQNLSWVGLIQGHAEIITHGSLLYGEQSLLTKYLVDIGNSTVQCGVLHV